VSQADLDGLRTLGEELLEPVREGDADREMVGDGVEEEELQPDALRVREPLEEAELHPDALRVHEPLGETEGEAENERCPVLETDCWALPELELRAEVERKALLVPQEVADMLLLSDTLMVAHGVLERVA
jgi:hypothetical protein